MIRSLLFVLFLFTLSTSFAQLSANPSVTLKSKSNYQSVKLAVDGDLWVITGGTGDFGDLPVATNTDELAYAKSQWIKVIIRLSELTVDQQVYNEAVESGTYQKVEKARIHWLNEIERLSPKPQPTN